MCRLSWRACVRSTEETLGEVTLVTRQHSARTRPPLGVLACECEAATEHGRRSIKVLGVGGHTALLAEARGGDEEEASTDSAGNGLVQSCVVQSPL